MTENQENLQLTFENEGDHQGVINLQWLRENCYSDAARRIDAQKRITEPHLGEVQHCFYNYSNLFSYMYVK